MKRVISGILAMLIVLPALEITSSINGSTASLPLGGLEMLHMQALTGSANTSAFNTSLQVRRTAGQGHDLRALQGLSKAELTTNSPWIALAMP